MKWFLLTLLLLGAPRAQAFTLFSDSPQWPGSSWTFYINGPSFVSHLNDNTRLDLSQGDYVWWVLYAASQWVVRGMADFEFDYAGNTTSFCYASATDGQSGSADGVSVIGARPVCTTNCTPRGRMYVVEADSNNDFVEVDICIFKQTGITYDIESDLATTEWDLLGVLTHEIGHALGLDHTDDTTMAGGGFGTGNTIRRFVTGDDSDGVRSIYGTRVFAERLREYSAWADTVWSSFSKPGGINLTMAGALTLDGGVWYVLRAALTTSQTQLYLDNTTYRASSGSSWANNWVSQTSFLPPSAASNDSGTDQTVVLIMPRDYTTYTGACNGIRSWTTSDRFATRTVATTTDICTSHQVGLGYDSLSDRWVMAYVGLFDDGSADEGLQSEILMRTSTNGLTWSVANELETGFHTIDAPAIACNADTGCILSFVDSATDYPTARNVAFSVSGSTISLGSSSTEGANLTARTPAVGTNSNGWFYQLLFWTSTYRDHANGRASIYSRRSLSIPIAYGSWNALGITSDVSPAVASHEDRAYGYIIVAD